VTLATRITLARILLVPLFVILAWRYGLSVAEGAPQAPLRWSALGVFLVAAASDGLDGWLARRRGECTRLGALLDPIADKLLLLSGLAVLTLVEWNAAGWRIPPWFFGIVLLRDGLIVTLIAVLKWTRGEVTIRTHWTGKVCVAAQMVVLAWIMLGWIPLAPTYPCLFTAVFCVWSGGVYLREFLHQWRHPPRSPSPG
jgi:CDP-diacylglycerol--glycerol-3-phosphate 3-phosphatidyltransferase